MVAGGALCARPAITPAASPKDKHTVVDALTENSVWWDGNRKMSKENFDNLLADFIKHAEGKKLFAQDLYGGADPKYRIKIRVFTELAWHSLFIRQLLIRPELKPSSPASFPNSPSSICPRSSRTPSVTVAAKAPTRWLPSTSPARSS